jgi:hypothetical protein
MISNENDVMLSLEKYSLLIGEGCFLGTFFIYV